MHYRWAKVSECIYKVNVLASASISLYKVSHKRQWHFDIHFEVKHESMNGVQTQPLSECFHTLPALLSPVICCSVHGYHGAAVEPYHPPETPPHEPAPDCASDSTHTHTKVCHMKSKMTDRLSTRHHLSNGHEEKVCYLQ